MGTCPASAANRRTSWQRDSSDVRFRAIRNKHTLGNELYQIDIIRALAFHEEVRQSAGAVAKLFYRDLHAVEHRHPEIAEGRFGFIFQVSAGRQRAAPATCK